MVTLGLLLVGLVILVIGAEALVTGSAKLAERVGISPLVVGLTVVSLGTSSPEMAVSVSAVLKGQTDLALGNVVGSNIFNVLFILGLCALAYPLVVSRQLIRFDVPVMIAVSFLCLAMAYDGVVGVIEGVVLLLLLVGYTVWLIRSSTPEERHVDHPIEIPAGSGWKKMQTMLPVQLVLIAGGLVLLVVGARTFVGASIELARWFGVSELVIGLTIVAAGTSMPEVFASLVATIRGERDIAVGNVIGSNTFNILGVLGLSALFSGSGLAASPQIVGIEILIMLGVVLICLPIFYTGSEINRWEGALLMGLYVAYNVYQVLNAESHAALPAFVGAMLYGVIPATFVGLTAHMLWHWNSRRQRGLPAPGSAPVE